MNFLKSKSVTFLIALALGGLLVYSVTFNYKNYNRYYKLKDENEKIFKSAARHANFELVQDSLKKVSPTDTATIKELQVLANGAWKEWLRYSMLECYRLDTASMSWKTVKDLTVYEIKQDSTIKDTTKND